MLALFVLAHRFELRIAKAAIPSHINAAVSQLKIARQTNPRLLDKPLTASDRDLIG